MIDSIIEGSARLFRERQSAEPNLPRFVRSYEFLVVLFVGDGVSELAALLLLESAGLSHEQYLLACGRIGWTPRHSLLEHLLPLGD